MSGVVVVVGLLKQNIARTNPFKGDWVLDEPRPAPTPDSCLSSAACDGCSLTAQTRIRCTCRCKFLQAKHCQILTFKGDWVSDDKAKYECLDGPTPAPTPDSCLTGSACDGCSLTVEVNGLTYCCNNYCDIGWINVDPATDPLCQCGHD